MINLNALSVSENEYTESFFGGNILADRDRIGEDGTYDEAVDALGVTSIRYPGGSLTEKYFDLSDPNRTSAIDPDTGKTVELLPYDEFMSYAEDNDLDVSIVIPTSGFLSSSQDANGNRYADIDEDLLRGFVQDTLDGVYGAPTITSFEIGNEYWGHSSGQMTSLEYGRIASRMAEIVDEELNNHANAEVFEDLQILVQNGQNYGTAHLAADYDHISDPNDQLAAVAADYGLSLDDSYIFNSGGLAWPRIANEIVMSEFDTASEQEAVDGLAVHIYSRGQGNTGSRDYDLDIIDQTWDNLIDDLEISVTEWNLKSSRSIWEAEEEYGLKQAHEILNMSEVFIERGVDEAFVWPLQQNNLTDLTGNEGGEAGELTVAGQMFQWMAESLPQTQAVNFNSSENYEHEAEADGANVHGFYDETKFVSFVASRSDTDLESNIDFSQIVDNPGTMTIEILGVPDGANPTSHSSTAEIRTVDPADAFSDGILSLDLEPWEIARVTMDNPDYTDDFEQVVQSDPPLPLITPPDDEPDDPGQGADPNDLADLSGLDDGDGGGGGFAAVLAVLPLLALLGGGF